MSNELNVKECPEAKLKTHPGVFDDASKVQ